MVDITTIALLGLFIAKCQRRPEGVDVFEVWSDARSDHPGLSKLAKTHAYRLVRRLVEQGILIEMGTAPASIRGTRTLYAPTKEGQEQYAKLVGEAVKEMSSTPAWQELYRFADLISSLEFTDKGAISVVIDERISELRKQRTEILGLDGGLNEVMAQWVQTTAVEQMDLEILRLRALRKLLITGLEAR